MPDLLVEVQALSAQLFEPDPVAEAAPDLTMLAPTYPAPPLPPPAAVDEPDPDARELVDFAAAGVDLEDCLRDAARELGEGAPGRIAEVMRALPRDVLTCMYREGLPLAALNAVGQGLATAGPADGVIDGEVDVDAVAIHARDIGLEIDLVEAAHVTCLLNSLPPAVRAGISEAVADDPEMWATAINLGRDLGGFELRRPITRS